MQGEEPKTWQSIAGLLQDELYADALAFKDRREIILSNIQGDDGFDRTVIRPIPKKRINLNGFQEGEAECPCCVGRAFCRDLSRKNGARLYQGPQDQILIIPSSGDYAFLLVPSSPHPVPKPMQKQDAEEIREMNAVFMGH